MQFVNYSKVSQKVLQYFRNMRHNFSASDDFVKVVRVTYYIGL